MYVCLYVRKINFVNFFKIGSYNFFLNFAWWKGTSIPIKWWRSHADWCIGCPFLGPFWAQFCPKTDTLLIFSKTVPTNFFILCMRIEDIDTYQMAKTASKLIHFFRSYSPKTGLMTSSFGPKFNRDKNSMGQGHYTVILRWNGWELDVFIIKGSGKCGGFCICDVGSSGEFMNLECILRLRKIFNSDGILDLSCRMDLFKTSPRYWWRHIDDDVTRGCNITCIFLFSY